MSNNKQQLKLKSKVSTPAPTNQEDEYQDEGSNENNTSGNSTGGNKPDTRTPQVYSDTEQYSSQPKTIGQVKWFNDKRGIGFITIKSGEHRGTDVFVHQTNVRPQLSNYRTLTADEYVEFVFGEADDKLDNDGKPTNNGHKYQALYVTGVLGGTLMCDGGFNRPNVSSHRPYRGGSNSNQYNNNGNNQYSGNGNNQYSGNGNGNGNRSRYDNSPPRRHNRSDEEDEYVGVGSRGRTVAPRARR